MARLNQNIIEVDRIKNKSMMLSNGMEIPADHPTIINFNFEGNVVLLFKQYRKNDIVLTFKSDSLLHSFELTLSKKEAYQMRIGTSYLFRVS